MEEVQVQNIDHSYKDNDSYLTKITNQLVVYSSTYLHSNCTYLRVCDNGIEWTGSSFDL